MSHVEGKKDVTFMKSQFKYVSWTNNREFSYLNKRSDSVQNISM